MSSLRESINASTAVRNAHEIIKNIWAKRSLDLTGQQGGGALSVIATDVDHHRSRRGLMIYPSVEFCTFGKNEWVVGFGYKGGSYPGDRYSVDLATVRGNWSPHFDDVDELDGETTRKMAVVFGDDNDGFHSSCLTVMRDGRLLIWDPNLRKIIGRSLPIFITSEEKRNRDIQFRDGEEEYVEFAYMYKPEFSQFLAIEISRKLGSQTI